MRSIKLCDLVLDYAIYPRREIDAYHSHTIQEAIAGGAEIPPLVVEKKTKRIVDGFHRHRAYKRLYGEDPAFAVDCIEKEYKSDAELFLDSMRYNASHGRCLSKFDRTHCLLLARQLHVPDKEIAKVLHITVKAQRKLVVDRSALKGNGKQVLTPIKSTIKHKAGQLLNDEQWSANDKLSGMQQAFYVNQIITLIENDLLDTSDEKLMAGLERLAELIAGVVAHA